MCIVPHTRGKKRLSEEPPIGLCCALKEVVAVLKERVLPL